MGLLSSIIALAIGTGLGFYFQNGLILLTIIAVGFSIYIGVRRVFDGNPQKDNSITNSALPASIFRSEFDEFEFTDDRKKTTLKNTLFTLVSFIVGMLIGDKLLPMMDLI